MPEDIRTNHERLPLLYSVSAEMYLTEVTLTSERDELPSGGELRSLEPALSLVRICAAQEKTGKKGKTDIQR